MEIISTLNKDNQTPLEGLAELVNPAKNSLFSSKLYDWLTKGKQTFCTHIFEDDRGVIYIGIIHAVDNCWQGNLLRNVLIYGHRASSQYFKPEVHSHLKDITVTFWENYLTLGIGFCPRVIDPG